jgi:hypothetical protein
MFLREAERRGAGLAVLAKRRRYGRARNGFFEVVLPLGDSRDARRQASRRAETLNRRARRNPQFAQPRLDTFGNLAREGRQPRGRQFLDANLDEKLSVHI